MLTMRSISMRQMNSFTGLKRKENTASAARKSFKITENFEKRLVYGKIT